MCGLVGMAGKLETKDEATMKRMLVFDYFRGPDSTGFSALRNDNTFHSAKIASNPADLMSMDKFKTALSGYNSKVFLGHNRAATKGAVTNNNAHPYTFQKDNGSYIIGAHNGTLSVPCWKELEEWLGEKFEVDSMALIACIAKFGIEETSKKLQGAWALTWYDTEDNTLNWLRNKERPFWYSYTEDFKKVLWASEHPIIHASVEMSANDYKLYESGEQHYRFFASKENWWYKFDLAKLQEGAAARPKPRVKELKGKEPTPVVTTYSAGGTAPFHTATTTSSTTSHGTTTGSVVCSAQTPAEILRERREEAKKRLGKTETGTAEGKDSNIFPFAFTGTKDKPYGHFLTKEEFDKMARFGCSWCADDVEFDDPGVHVYQHLEAVVCASCAASDSNRMYLAQ